MDRSRLTLVVSVAAVLAATAGIGAALVLRDDGETIEVGGSATDSSSPTTGSSSDLRLPGGLFLDPNSTIQTWLAGAPDDPRAGVVADNLGSQPVATWYGSWNDDLMRNVRTHVLAAEADSAVAVTVLYETAAWSCESPLTTTRQADDYLARVREFGAGLGPESTAVVVLEPGVLDGLACLDQKSTALVLQTQATAVTDLTEAAPDALTYLDAGPADDVTAQEMAWRLDRAGLRAARGFAVNVTSVLAQDDMIAWADEVNAALEAEFGYRKPYVLDSSRSGGSVRNPDAWCNAPDARLGEPPRVGRAGEGPELFLWIGAPGVSDGDCGEGVGTTTGEFVPDLALRLIENG